MDPLRKEVHSRLSELITYIKDDENLSAKWSLVKILRGGKSFRSLTKRLDLNKEIVSKVENAFEAEPQKMEELAKKAADLNARMRKAGITTRSLGSSCLLGKCLGKTLLALLGLPYFMFSLIASLPMWVAALFIRNKGIKDKAFGNTVSFGVKLGLGAIWYPIVALICFLTAPWFIALPVALLAVPTYNYFYDYTELCRILFSDMKLFFCRKYEREANDIQSIFSKLV